MVSASPTAIRPDAGALIDGQRRPLANRERLARVVARTSSRGGAVGDGHLPRADALIARAEAADGPVADGDEERLVAHRRRAQDPLDRLRQVDRRPCRTRRGRARAAPRPSSFSAACRATRASPCPPVCCRTAGRGLRGAAPRSSRRQRRTGSARGRTWRRTDRGESGAIARTYRSCASLHQTSRGVIPGSSFGAARKSMRAPRCEPCAISGSAFDRPPAPTSWIERIGFVGAERPAPVDHLLRAPLNLRVAALDRVEVEIRGVRAGRHRRSRPATHTDEHARAAQLDQQRAGRDVGLVRVLRLDVAEASGQHDGLVVAAHDAGRRLLERAEVAREVRPAEFVVERGCADRPVDHDGQRRRDPLRLRLRAFPRAHESRDSQVRDREPAQPRLRLRPAARRAFVANLTARTGGGARETARWPSGGCASPPSSGCG